MKGLPFLGDQFKGLGPGRKRSREARFWTRSIRTWELRVADPYLRGPVLMFSDSCPSPEPSVCPRGLGAEAGPEWSLYVTGKFDQPEGNLGMETKLL